jgi:hypothetical protein
MVKVTFKPLKEIVIHEAIEHKLEDLVKLRVLGLRKETIAQPLVWTEGVVINRSPFPITDDVVKDQLEGIIHFGALEWAKMPKYRDSLKLEGVTIPIINVSDNPNMSAIANALKSQEKG